MRCKIRCIETGEIYESCVHAYNDTGIHRYSINNVLNGK